jgi:hypothetical protein
MLKARVVNVGRRTRQIITTDWQHGEPGTPHAELHEHVTLATPTELSDTQKLRLMTTQEARDVCAK